MATDLDHRRFDDRQFALILRRAQELQERGGESGSTERRGGLSLAEIQQIAAEVGIDPRYVELAVDALPAGEPSGAHALVGPWSWDTRRVVPGELPDAEKGRILDAIRGVIKHKGELETAYGRVEWTYDDTMGPIQVRVVPDQGETRVEVSARRGGELGLWYGLTVPLGTMFVNALLVKVLVPDSPVEMLPFMGLTAVGLAAGVRAAWRVQARRWSERVAKLSERVTEAVRRGISDGEEEQP